MKRLICTLLTTLTLLSCAVPISAVSAQTFSDVPTTHWAYSYIQQAARDGVVNGVGNGKFNPDGPITRAQIMALMARIICTDAEIDKFDVGGPWYLKYQRALQSRGALEPIFESGFSQTIFGDLNKNATRAEMTTFVEGVARIRGKFLISNGETGACLNFVPDVDSMDPYSESIAFCYYHGIISGVDKAGNFHPNDNITRAQFATVYCNLAKTLKDPNVPIINLSNSPELPESEEILKKRIMRNYCMFLGDAGIDQNTTFQFAYIDNDDIPELLLADTHGYHQSILEIYKVFKDAPTQVKQVGEYGEFGKMIYEPKKNIVVQRLRYTGSSMTDFISLPTTQNEQAKTIKSFGDNEFVEGVTPKFLIDNQNISKDAYLAEYNSYVQGRSFKEIDGNKGFYASRDALVKAIYDYSDFLNEGTPWTPSRYD